MTDLTLWKCDICGKEFRDGVMGVANRQPMQIVVPKVGTTDEDSIFAFDDVCVSCRTRMVIILGDDNERHNIFPVRD